MSTAPQKGSTSSVLTLQEASQLTSNIFDASQKIKRNKSEFNRLITDISEFVKDMIFVYRSLEGHFPTGVPEDLALVFLRAVNSLKSIQKFTHDVASRNFFMALLFSRLDIREIKAYDQMVTMNKGSFNIIANAHVRDLLTELSPETLVALAQRLDDATGT